MWLADFSWFVILRLPRRRQPSRSGDVVGELTHAPVSFTSRGVTCVNRRVVLPTAKNESIDCQEFDIVDQVSCGDAATTSLLSVSKGGRNPEASLFADDHAKHAFMQTRDKMGNNVDRRFAAPDGGLEQSAIGGPAGKMHLDLVGGVWVSRPCAFLKSPKS